MSRTTFYMLLAISVVGLLVLLVLPAILPFFV